MEDDKIVANGEDEMRGGNGKSDNSTRKTKKELNKVSEDGYKKVNTVLQSPITR